MTENEDCISRQVALHEIDKRFDLAKSFKQLIKSLPSVTPAEKVGRWEYVQYDYNPKLGDWCCSECRSVVIECVGKNEKGGIPLYKYCPQCGKKMEKVENDF